jgi:hypothetical protein
MHAPGNRPARWTKTKSARRADCENGPVRFVERTFDKQTHSAPDWSGEVLVAWR